MLEAFAAHGLVLPGDQAVIGFDDAEASQFCWPPLTSVRADFAEVGRHAGELLIGQLTGSRVESRLHLVPTTLTIRQSCGCAPVETPSASSPAEDRAEQFRQRAYLQGALLTQYAVSTSLLGTDFRGSK